MITSIRNRHVAAAARLKKRGIREQAGRFLVEGAQAAGEAIQAGMMETMFHSPGAGGRVPEVLAAGTRAGAQSIAVSDSVMAHLTSAVTPQGVVGVARFVDVPLGDIHADRGPVPVLCSVRDPGNAGAILRSADAAGAAGVVFTRASVDVYNAKTVRASAGSLFHLPVSREVETGEAVASLRATGAHVLAATADGEASVYEVDLTRPTALLIGNEAWGLVPEVRELADRSVRVPIRGRAESLNLAAAAALLMFEAARQRGASNRAAGGVAKMISAGAHDIRLPLTALKGFGATLMDQWDRFDDAARREMVDVMVLDTERVSAMIGMIVDAARMETGGLRLTSERGDVGEALRWVGDLFARSRDYPSVEARGGAEASFDRERLHAVLLALCEGAMWWGQEGPIRVEARPRNGKAVIEVRRAGEGPTEAQVQAMFAGTEAHDAKIGLHIARQVTEAMGGTLTCRGGDGVTYRLTLPG